MTATRRILVAQPDRAQSRLLFLILRRAAGNLAVVKSVSAVAGSELEETYQEAEAADLLVVDVTESNPAAMYVLGYAHAKDKPVLILYENADPPFDVTGVRSLRYNPDEQDAFSAVFRATVQQALSDPSRFVGRPRTGPPGTTVFISYNHRDKAFLERLQVHMRPIEKAQQIELWDDTRIRAGQPWKVEVDKALKRAKAAVLLISADFLGSDFITNNELPPLLEKAKSDGTRILPVVLKTCRFLRDPRLNIFQAVNDPARPLAELTEIEQEKIYDKICQEIESFGPAPASPATAP